MNWVSKHAKALCVIGGICVYLIAVSTFAGVIWMFLNIPSLGPMQKAARDGDLGKMSELVDGGVNVNAPCEFSHLTALHTAAAAGRVEAVKWLIAHGASLDPRDDDGFTPLALTAADSSGRPQPEDTIYGRHQVAAILIEHGANMHTKTNFGMTLRNCAASGHDQLLQRMFMEHGGDP